MDALELFARHLRRYVKARTANDPELREVCLRLLEAEVERVRESRAEGDDRVWRQTALPMSPV